MAMFVEGLGNFSKPERYFLRTVLRMKNSSMFFGKTSQGIAEHDLSAKNYTSFSLWLQIVKMQGNFVQKLNININEEKLSVSGKTLFQSDRFTVW